MQPLFIMSIAPAILRYAKYGPVAVVLIGVLILVHELGHFLAAKKVGIKVERFSIGFGPKMVGFTKGDTEYRISWLPVFGGYVKMLGENPAERPDDEITEGKTESEEGRFDLAPVSHRMIVAVAGPGMNIVFAVLAVTLAYMIGLPPASDTTVGYVQPNSPASEVGIMKGDKIISVGGHKVKTFSDIQENVFINSGKEIEIALLRNGDKEITVQVTPAPKHTEVALFGIELGFQNDLDSKIISENLRQELENNGILLSEDANILIEETGSKWVIVDKGRRYLIKKEAALFPHGSSEFPACGGGLPRVPPGESGGRPPPTLGDPRSVVVDSSPGAPQSGPADLAVATLTVRRYGETVEVPFALKLEDMLVVYWEEESIIIGISSFTKPIIGYVAPGSVAAEAGLRQDDVVEAVNHSKVRSTIEFENELQSVFEKGGQLMSRGGLYFGRVESLNPIAAFGSAISETIRMGGKIFQWLKWLIVREVSPKHLAGPVGMVQITMVILNTGAARTLWFAGFLNINLGIVNLLPLFITDGALIVFLVIEKLRGKPMGRKRQLIIKQVGVAFIIVTFLLLTYNDVLRWITGGF